MISTNTRSSVLSSDINVDTAAKPSNSRATGRAESEPKGNRQLKYSMHPSRRREKRMQCRGCQIVEEGGVGQMDGRDITGYVCTYMY